MSIFKNKALTAMRAKIETRVATTFDDIEIFRQAWGQMQAHPNSDIDAYLINVRALENILMPYVMLLLVDDQPTSILIGRLEETRVEYKMGFKTLRGPRLRQLVVIYQGFLGDTSAESASCFMTEIRKRMASEQIDAVFFYALQVESELYKAANRAAGILTRDHGTKLAEHWKTILPPEGIEGMLQNISSKHRYWLRRLPKVLEKDFPGQVVYRRFSEPAEVEQLSVDCEKVASKTYHRAAGAGFKDSPLWRRKFSLWANKHSLRGHVLYINNEPCAFWLGNLYGETLHLDFTGYLSEYKKYELGTILFLKMIEDAIASGARELDYGLGALWYKERFGGESWTEASIYLFAPTFKGISANLTRTGISKAAELLKWLLDKAGATTNLKNKWRDILSAKSRGGLK
jgi:hypothetical protein